MPRAHADSERLGAFADDLVAFAAYATDWARDFLAALEKLHESWRDDEFTQFRNGAQRACAVLAALASEAETRAAPSLRRDAEALEEYAAVLSGGPRPTARTGGLIHSSAGPSFELGGPLPAGFRWVPLKEIDLGEIPEDLEYSKVSAEEMQETLLRTQSDILPALATDPSRGLEYFVELDRRAGNAYPGPNARAYEAIFGSDPIHLQRGYNGGPCTISNGRHRILLMKKLGWSAAPATGH